MLRTLILVILALSSYSANCQILNLEKKKIEKKDTTNYFLANTNATMTINNVSAGIDDPIHIMGFGIGASVGYVGKKHFYRLINRMDYLNVNEDIITNTGYSHFRISFNHNQTFHPEVFGQYQFDNIRGLHPRLLAGAGLRYRFFQTEKLTLIVSPGAMYEYEKWAQPYIEGVFVEMNLIKSTNYLNARWKVNSHIDLNGIAYFQTGYDRSISGFRHRISGEANLLVKVSKKLNLTTTFIGSYESKPIVPIVPFIFSLTNGLQFSL
ncbi:DUF481 domain-containing protein [Cytophagaceae bacterium ABcell3]|nr:DUF481 domain-containing protein [Cytophagaceae bacterium ABcell3]